MSAGTLSDSPRIDGIALGSNVRESPTLMVSPDVPNWMRRINPVSHVHEGLVPRSSKELRVRKSEQLPVGWEVSVLNVT